MMCIHSNKWREFANICTLISHGDKEIIFSHIQNKLVKDFVSECLKDDPEDRPVISQLLEHKFLTEEVKEDNSFKI